MKKFLKVLIINMVILISFLLNFKINISYCLEYDKIDQLIFNQEKEVYLNEKISDLDNIIDNEQTENNSNYLLSSDIIEKQININTLKISQINLIKTFFEKELVVCQNKEETLLQRVKEERKDALAKSNATYIKGIWPLEDYTYVSSNFGYRIHPITKELKFHNGVDIPAPKNTNVLASDDGIVIFAKYTYGYGNVVKIEHFDGKITVYAHNNSLLVKEGDIVKKGQVISKVGSTGNSTGNHVHFEVIINNKRIDPLDGVSSGDCK